MFRIRFTTNDGVLVMDREADPSYWLRYGKVDKEFAGPGLDADARTKGVRVLSYELSGHGQTIEVKVAWL